MAIYKQYIRAIFLSVTVFCSLLGKKRNDVLLVTDNDGCNAVQVAIAEAFEYQGCDYNMQKNKFDLLLEKAMQ